MSDNRLFNHLINDAAFKKCNYQSLARLLPQIVEHRYAPGERIYTCGAPADFFCLLMEGEIDLVAPSGRHSPLMHPRFGEEAASDSDHYLTDAYAVDEVHVLAIPRAAMTMMVASNPGLTTDLMFSLASHLAGENLERVIAPRPAAKKPPLKLIPWAMCVIAPLATLWLGSHYGLALNITIFAAIFSATAIMWACSMVDDYIPGLFALLAILATGLVPVPVILSGFASDSFLMALSTLALSTVVVTSGLSYRFMLNLLLRLPNTQFWQFFGLFISGALITPIIPTANGRIALVAPFYADMLSSLQFKSRGKAATRLALACFSGISVLSAMIVTSKSVNFVVFGLLTPQGQDYFQFMPWLMASGVVLVVLLGLTMAAAAFAFRNEEVARLSKERVAEQLKLMGNVKLREWAAMAGIGFLMFGIVSSSLHKMTPPWLGFAVLFSLLLCGTLRKQEFKENVDWTFLLYLSGITGIVATFNHLGIDHMLGRTLPGLGAIMRDNMPLFIVLLFGLINVVRIAVPTNATVVILAAIFMPLAEINGVNSWVVGFLILLFSDCWFLPFQNSFYLQLMELNRERSLYDERSFLSVNAWLNFARLGAVYASLPYWKALGLL